MSVQTASLPLVSVGMPVRNGSPYFARAIESVLAQDYPNIEIVVSDNCSEDDTSVLLGEVVARDQRVRVARQPEVLTAFDNFAWVLRQAKGKYFLWAAHDDLRPIDYVSRLVAHLEGHSQAVLAFGDLRVSPRFGAGYRPKAFSYETVGMGCYARMRKAAHQQCYHIYGVWRNDVLKAIPFIFNPWWPDLPLMISAAGMGEFHRVDGVLFDYLEMQKTNEERVKYQDNSDRVCRICRTLKLFRVTFSTVLRVKGDRKSVV